MKTKAFYRKEYERKLHAHFGISATPEQVRRIREVAADLADGNVQWYDAVKFVEQAKGVEAAV